MQAEFLIFQAKSFYNAYLNLERIDMQSGDFLFTVPMLVNGAFSIELSLKAILPEIASAIKKNTICWFFLECCLKNFSVKSSVIY